MSTSRNIVPVKNSDERLSHCGFTAADNTLLKMHNRACWWDTGRTPVTKAPLMWQEDDEVPDFVTELIDSALDEYNPVYDRGYSGQDAKSIKVVKDELEENLRNPQGWSVESIVDDLVSEIPDLSSPQAVTIARTETGAVLNKARELAYRNRPEETEYFYAWEGPDDSRTSVVCESVKEEIDRRGGSVTPTSLRRILRDHARAYTNRGGLPDRVDEYVPHFNCRHTMVREGQQSVAGLGRFTPGSR